MVNYLMNRCGVPVWYQQECEDLEIMKNIISRLLWDVGNVRNELIRGETCWGTFEERKIKMRKVDVRDLENMFDWVRMQIQMQAHM